MAGSEDDAGRDPAILSRAVLSPDQVPRGQSEPLVAPRVPRDPRDGEPALDRDPGAHRAEALLAPTSELRAKGCRQHLRLTLGAGVTPCPGKRETHGGFHI